MSDIDPATIQSVLEAVQARPRTIAEARQKYTVLLAVICMIPGITPGTERVLATIISDLDAISTPQPADSELLSYDEAAHISGYSKKQLARLAAGGVVKSVGSNRNRRFERASLPSKPGHRPPPPPATQPQLAAERDDGYDATADARELRARLDLAS
jgi:hypothetical protein